MSEEKTEINNKPLKRLASRYIVDIDVFKTHIVLRDSSRNEFFVDLEDTAVVEKFKLWFNKIFLKGISGTLTILSYKTITREDSCSVNIIQDFNNVVSSCLEKNLE